MSKKPRLSPRRDKERKEERPTSPKRATSTIQADNTKKALKILIPKLIEKANNSVTSVHNNTSISNSTSDESICSNKIIDIPHEESSDIEIVGTNPKSSPTLHEFSTSIISTSKSSSVAINTPKIVHKPDISKKPKAGGGDKKVVQSSLSQFIKITGEPKVPRITETKYEPVKIPRPMKHTWAKTIKPYTPSNILDDSSIIGSKYIDQNYDTFKFDKLGGVFEGILMNPPWNMSGYDDADDNSITPEQLATWKLGDNVMPAGLLFIWSPKELYLRIINAMASWKFEYVENLVWVQLSVNNKLETAPSTYFRKSKLSLLLFKKITKTKIELRHQRNPDVVFDFIKEPGNATDLVYTTIETLLPNSEYKESNGRGKLLELWCMPGHRRKGWTTVHFQNTPFNTLKQIEDEQPAEIISVNSSPDISCNYTLKEVEIDEESSKIPISDDECSKIPISDDECSSDAFDEEDYL